jgi:hypothetical protein
VPGQIAPCQLAKSALRIYRDQFAEPIAHECKRLHSSDHRATHDQASKRRQGQQVDERLPSNDHSCRNQTLAESVALERAFFCQRSYDRRNAAFGGVSRDSLLSQTSGVGGCQLGRRQSVEPWIVLCADQVKGSSVEPRDQQRAVLRQPGVYLAGGETRAPRPYGEARTARILGLDREKTLDHRDRIMNGRAGEQLRRQPLRENRHQTRACPE